MSISNDRELREQERRWRNSRERARSPAGYLRFQNDKRAYLNGNRNSGNNQSQEEFNRRVAAEVERQQERDEGRYNHSPYKDSDAYNRNQSRIREAGQYRGNKLAIEDRRRGESQTQANRRYQSGTFEGINRAQTPGSISAPNLARIPRYTGRERFQGMKKNQRFRDTNSMPSRRSTNQLKIRGGANRRFSTPPRTNR